MLLELAPSPRKLWERIMCKCSDAVLVRTENAGERKLDAFSPAPLCPVVAPSNKQSTSPMIVG
jgi:hypothetical protein